MPEGPILATTVLTGSSEAHSVEILLNGRAYVLVPRLEICGGKRVIRLDVHAADPLPPWLAVPLLDDDGAVLA